MIHWQVLGAGLSVGILSTGVGVWIKVRERIMAHSVTLVPTQNTPLKLCGQCGKPDNHPTCCLTAIDPLGYIQAGLGKCKHVNSLVEHKLPGGEVWTRCTWCFETFTSIPGSDTSEKSSIPGMPKKLDNLTYRNTLHLKEDKNKLDKKPPKVVELEEGRKFR